MRPRLCNNATEPVSSTSSSNKENSKRARPKTGIPGPECAQPRNDVGEPGLSKSGVGAAGPNCAGLRKGSDKSRCR